MTLSSRTTLKSSELRRSLESDGGQLVDSGLEKDVPQSTEVHRNHEVSNRSSRTPVGPLPVISGRAPKHRECEWQDCTVQPSYAYEGEKSRFCRTHKTKTMVDVQHRRCGMPNCTKQPHFALQKGKARFCSAHKVKGMVNVQNKRCGGPDCQREPIYGMRGQKARFCGSHKLKGMMNVKSRRCEHEPCLRHPLYAMEGQRARFCSLHKKDGMVDVQSRKCEATSCNRRSLYGCAGEKARFCSEHKEEGMVIVQRRRCEAKDCGRYPIFALPMEHKGRFCHLHKSKEMLNVQVKRGPRAEGISGMQADTNNLAASVVQSIGQVLPYGQAWGHAPVQAAGPGRSTGETTGIEVGPVGLCGGGTVAVAAGGGGRPIAPRVQAGVSGSTIGGPTAGSVMQSVAVLRPPPAAATTLGTVGSAIMLTGGEGIRTGADSGTGTGAGMGVVGPVGPSPVQILDPGVGIGGSTGVGIGAESSFPYFGFIEGGAAQGDILNNPAYGVGCGIPHNLLSPSNLGPVLPIVPAPLPHHLTTVSTGTATLPPQGVPRAGIGVGGEGLASLSKFPNLTSMGQMQGDSQVSSLPWSILGSQGMFPLNGHGVAEVGANTTVPASSGMYYPPPPTWGASGVGRVGQSGIYLGQSNSGVGVGVGVGMPYGLEVIGGAAGGVPPYFGYPGHPVGIPVPILPSFRMDAGISTQLYLGNTDSIAGNTSQAMSIAAMP